MLLDAADKLFWIFPCVFIYGGSHSLYLWSHSQSHSFAFMITFIITFTIAFIMTFIITFIYIFVTNLLPTCYQLLNMILLYLCRPALKARSRFSWSPFYVENILILWLYPFIFHGISSERGSGAFHRSIPSKHPIRGAWEPGRTQNWLIDWVAGRHSWKSMTTGDDAMTTSLSTLFPPRQNLHANLTKTVSFRRLRFANTPVNRTNTIGASTQQQTGLSSPLKRIGSDLLGMDITTSLKWCIGHRASLLGCD